MTSKQQRRCISRGTWAGIQRPGKEKLEEKENEKKKKKSQHVTHFLCVEIFPVSGRGKVSLLISTPFLIVNAA